MPERRTHARYQIQPGTFAYYALGAGTIRDLSMGGVFIEDRHSSFSVGARVELELRLEHDSVGLRGVVQRIHPQIGFAVQFEKFPARARKRLERYFKLRYRSPQK